MKASRLWDTENPSSAETKKGFKAKDYASLIKGLELVEKTEHNLGGLEVLITGRVVSVGEAIFHAGLHVTGTSVKVRTLGERIGVADLDDVGVSRNLGILRVVVHIALTVTSTDEELTGTDRGRGTKPSKDQRHSLLRTRGSSA